MTAITDRTFDRLRLTVHDSDDDVAHAAAEEVAAIISAALADTTRAQRSVRVMFATGASQIALLDRLVRCDVEWGSVVGLHMDEYVGLAPGHPASLRSFLAEHVVDRLPLAEFHGMDGDAPDLDAECRRYAAIVSDAPIDLCLLGIGPTGHLAFNDPPDARFDDPDLVRVVRLAPASKEQQAGQGNFESVARVPDRALTVTIPALMSSARLLVLATGSHKAEVVARTLRDPIGPGFPATVLRRHRQAHLLVDRLAGAGIEA